MEHVRTMEWHNIGGLEQWDMSEQWGGITLGVQNNGTCRNNGVSNSEVLEQWDMSEQWGVVTLGDRNNGAS